LFDPYSGEGAIDTGEKGREWKGRGRGRVDGSGRETRRRGTDGRVGVVKKPGVVMGPHALLF